MRELLEDVEPFIGDQEVIEDLRTMISTLESMEIFKNLGLLDMKCIEFKFEFRYAAIFLLANDLRFFFFLQTSLKKCSTTGTSCERI